MTPGTRRVTDPTPVLAGMLKKLVSVRDGEEAALLWSTAYGFCIFLSYYILRPVRDEISSADRGNLQYIWTAVFLVMLAAVPLYSWVASRHSRGVFVPLANRFFITNLLLFYGALHMFSEAARPWIDRAYYVWVSVFALFVVTVFWGFLADVFRNEQGKRLFPFIAVGASTGAIAGSALTTTLVEAIPPFSLLLIACIPLEIASWCAGVLHRRFGGRLGTSVTANEPLRGTALSGIKIVFGSPYLMGIAVYLALMTFSSTILYFHQAELIGQAFAEDRAARTAFYANIDLAVNVITIGLQVVVTAQLIRLIGIALSLTLVPAVTFLGFLSLGTYPLLAVLVVFQVAYRSGRYGIAKPAREVLFTVVGREEKYKSKAFLDAAVYRGGDLASGWIYAGLTWIGLSLGAIALVAAPLAAVWVGVGWMLGTKQEELAREA